MEEIILDKIKLLRIRNREYRKLIESKEIQATIHSVFCTNVIEISCALAELVIIDNKSLKEEDSYWFEGGYFFNFEFAGGAYKDILDLYLDLWEFMRDKNYIRESRSVRK